MLCKVAKVGLDGFLRVLMQQEWAFFLGLVFSPIDGLQMYCLSSSHLDYCSRIAGNRSNQGVAVLRRITLERCTLNWQIYMNSKTIEDEVILNHR